MNGAGNTDGASADDADGIWHGRNSVLRDQNTDSKQTSTASQQKNKARNANSILERACRALFRALRGS